jgi:hypothetical protein
MEGRGALQALESTLFRVKLGRSCVKVEPSDDPTPRRQGLADGLPEYDDLITASITG